MWLHNKIKGPVFQDKMHGQVHTQSDNPNPTSPPPTCKQKTVSMEVKNKKTITNDTTYSNIPWGKMSLHLPHHAYGSISLCTPPLTVIHIIIKMTYIINIWNDFIHHLKDCFQICRYGQYAVKYKHVCEHQSL